ncbi:oxygenase MpaB family protein [Aspergillus lucknowensis]|uniref:ER-bound oxygenase mpaB/mpaB'/Rubber oxygenase catalytic domain-containing protein n=1 Tax=Aspergillus lucknowensis TaxID=176173 RepID=A0ABR4L9I9_9EURO
MSSASENEKHTQSETDLIMAALDNPQHIQKVVSEAIILGGGAAAILLQVAHPGVAKGVNYHSSFAQRPVDRLRTTMTYVYSMLFGTPREKKKIIELVHQAHASIQGPDYAADDPSAQLWVAATLYAVAIDLYEQIFGVMDEDKAEAVYREYVVLGASLRVPLEMWPRTRAAFWVYWDEQLASFEVCDEAKSVAHDLLYNPKLPVYFKVMMPTLRLVTAELLPPRLREAYGLKTSKSRKRLYRSTMLVTKATYPFFPKAIRTFPVKYYMKDMRKRMAKYGEGQRKI